MKSQCPALRAGRAGPAGTATGICDESGLTPLLTDAALRQLAHTPFNGNVRELENMLHRAVARCDGGAGFELNLVGSRRANLQDYLDLQERILSKVLMEHSFNRQQRQLGLSLRQIHRTAEYRNTGRGRQL
jgi:two-component system response regulator PilR (NtrC family)